MTLGTNLSIFLARSYTSIKITCLHPNEENSSRVDFRDVAVAARRLGMRLHDIQPECGKVGATGNGHMITSNVRFDQSTDATTSETSSDRGLILSYQRILPLCSLTVQPYIEGARVDGMWFGILPGCKELGIQDFKMGVKEEIYDTLDKLDPTYGARQKIEDIRRLDRMRGDTPGFSELIALAATMLRPKGGSDICVPIPTPDATGLLSHKEGFVVLHHYLKIEVGRREGPSQMYTILEQYERLKRHKEWEDGKLADRLAVSGSTNLQFLDEVQECWEAATGYFIFKKDEICYYDLVAAFIAEAVNWWGDAWERIRNGTARHHFGLRADKAEGAHMYYNYLPSIVERLQRGGYKGDEQLVQEAWFTMCFRAFCWSRCHSLSPEQDMEQDPQILPSRYFDRGSQGPLWLKMCGFEEMRKQLSPVPATE